MFDDWFERGGNCFDTAYVYGGGLCEVALGWWVKNRNVRKDVVIIGKGAHTPCCDPRNLTNQLHQSLERQHTDYFDIYMMHRDNLAIPVGEFVEVLNEHVKAGRIKVFGGSNWTLARVDEANAYAKAHGLQGFGMVSNNFALSHLLQPMWAGCLHSSDAASRKWFTDRQMPLFPWSSQGRGFFVEGNAAPDKKDDPDLMRWWYSDDNFKRLERARELAKNRGCLPINIALAYVLCQPFPTFPLIGPRNLWETRTSLRALEIQLSPQELAWLSLDE
jgi:aryl-alcohol dehydrogenase-like predicted oxidoreductase